MIKSYDNFKMYDVKTVKRGYQFYIKFFFEKTLGMFTYKRLPESLPAIEIEKRLMWDGFGGVFDAGKKFGVVICDGGLSGIDQYYKPTEFCYAQPVLGSGTLKINDKCVIMYNTQSDIVNPYGFRELIKRYARLMADVDSSIDIQIINSRATKLNSVADSITAKSVNNAMQAIESGENYTVNQNSIIDKWVTKDWNTAHPETIEKLLDARQSILNSFLEEIGVKSINAKRERMITDEVCADNQLLMVNTDDLLYMRKLGVAQINDMFGFDIDVELNENYDISKNISMLSNGGVENDNTAIS